MNVNKIMFVLGLLVALTAAALLLLGVIESGVAAAIGILGIGLIAASGRIKRDPIRP
jgi:small-conductance mechanosensitive channel